MAPAIYTPEQVRQYLRYINYPDAAAAAAPADNFPLPPPTYQTLTTLQRYQTSKCPFENLALHYAKTKKVVVDKEYSFNKIVINARGRGGYCHELNNLYATVLRTLGFELICTGGKIGIDQPWGCWGHFIIIVIIDGKKYLTDTGLGANNITQPVPLMVNNIVKGIGSEEYHFLYEPIPDQTIPMWILQMRYSSTKEWLNLYAFSDKVEFSHEDFILMSYKSSTESDTFFTNQVMCARTIIENGDIVGRLIMTEGPKGIKERRANQESKTLSGDFKTDSDRIQGLEKWFGLFLTDDEKEGIKGYVTEIA